MACCIRCWKEDDSGDPLRLRPFIVCQTCGNKRCPKATDHRLACTDSNAPGQPGSAHKVRNRAVDDDYKAHNLKAALRFHKHPLTQQAADRIEALEAALFHVCPLHPLVADLQKSERK